MSNWPAQSTPPSRQRLAPAGRLNLIFESPFAPITIPGGRVPVLKRGTAENPRRDPYPPQAISIAHGERGGNGVNPTMVNRWFLFRAFAFRTSVPHPDSGG